MNKGEIEFIADTLLIQKVASIEYGIQKTAGFGDALLGKLGEGVQVIQEEILGLIDTSSVSSALSDFAGLVANGALFQIWWPLGAINTIAKQVYGVDIITVGKMIWSMISGKLAANGSITPQEVSDATKEATRTFASSGSDTAEVKDSRAYDLFEPWRTADKSGQLYKLARPRRGGGGAKGFFSSIAPFKGKSILGGLAGWVIKAALMGAGLMAGTGVAARFLGLKDAPAPAASSTNESQPAQEQEQAVPVNLTPTGRGQDTHANDHQKSQWVVPLVQGSVEKTLIAWAADVYEELAGRDHEIHQVPSFNKVVNEMKSYMSYGNTSRVAVPPQYKSRKQVVDQFARDVAAKISAPTE